MTGLSTDTIRAWERRYALVKPLRNDAGVRLYREHDVARLDLARAAVTLGHPIRQVAELSDAAIRSLVEAASSSSPRLGLQSQAAERTIEDIVKAIEQYDLSSAESQLNSAALLFTPAELVVDVLGPFMREIGARWEAGSLSIAQEHFASNLVRSLLGSMMRMRPPSGEETMVFVTPPHEEHEFGILFAACLASLRGFRALVLGTNVPAKELIRASRKIQPQRIVMGLIYTTDEAALGAYVAEVQRGIPSHTAITLGGQGVVHAGTERYTAGVERIGTLLEFAARLGRPAR